MNVLRFKGNVDATENILRKLHEVQNTSLYVFYDNALSKIQDKAHMQEYIELAKNPDFAEYLPFTLSLLARWKNETVKQILTQYVTSDCSDNLRYHCLNALSYYKDPVIDEIVKIYKNSTDKNIQRILQKKYKPQ